MYIETGVFALLNILSFGCMLIGIRPQLPLAPALHIVAMVLFFELSLIMTGGFDIASIHTEIANDDITTWNTTSYDVVISADSAPIFNWVYFGFGVLTMLLFIIRWRDK